MQSFSYKYKNDNELIDFVKSHGLEHERNCLIQVFSGRIDKAFLQALLRGLVELLPQAHIIGATTDGEIQNKQVSLHETIISFSVFDNAKLSSGHVIGKESCVNAQKLYRDVAHYNTKLMIAFADGIHANGEEILDTFHEADPNLIVAGGMAGDNAEFEITYIMHQDQVLSEGIVAVAIESDSLEVNTHYSFDWVPIGSEMLVTKAEGNRVYEINGISAYETYKKYLGTNAALQLPRIGVEFPLIMQENGINIARAIMKTHEDGSLSFAGNLPQGVKVRFGVGNPDLILHHGHENSRLVQEYPVESVFIYSCMARRRFMQENIICELELYPKEIPVSGFFTYGEFFSKDNKNKLLNQSMTILMLSETKAKLAVEDVKPLSKNIQKAKEYSETLEALAHLVNVTSDDLKQLNQSLEQRVDDKVRELEKSTKFFQKIFETANEGIWVVDLNKETIMANAALSEILGYSEEEIMGRSIFDFVDDTGRKKIEKYAALTQRGKGGHQYEVELIHKNKQRIYCLFSTEALSNERGEIIGSFAMVSDISQRKHAEEELVSFNYLLEERIAEEVLKNHSKDELMSKQMRLAQMGEMISMIAHQWRQPLSTISAIVASMQLELSLSDQEDTGLYKDMEKVSEHIQFLSNTIDDFRHFFNPKKSKERVTLCTLMDNALSIVEQSLIKMGIDVTSDFQHMQRPIKLYASEFVQVLLNLIKNSMDVLEEKHVKNAYISIRGSEYEDKSVITIEDNGGGIPVNILDKVFEPYFTTKDEKNGTGLGLYMSKMIIDEHCNGHIIVENTSVGARFTIALEHD